jgi:TP901 family phage tail tape measure protein
MGDSFATIAKGITTAFAVVGTALVGIGTKAILAGDTAGGALRDIQAQTKQTSDDLQKTENRVREIARETGEFTAQEMREALAGVSRSGQDSEHQLTLLDNAMRLSSATGMDLGSSMYTLDKLMVKYGTEVEDVGKWVNVLAVAQQESGISQESMLDGMQRAAGVAGIAGLEYDFVAAALSVAYENGMSMQTASTGLTSVFNDMLNPQSRLRAGMEDLGVELVKNEDGTTNAQESFLKLLKAMDETDPATREQTLANMGLTGSYLTLVDSLLTNQDELEELTGFFGYAIKAGDEYSRTLQMAEYRGGGFGEAMQGLRNIGQDFLYQIFDIIGAPLYEWLLNATDKLRDMLQEMKDNGTIERLGDAILTVVQALLGFVEAIVPIIIEWFPKFADFLVRIIEFATNNAGALMLVVGGLKAMKVVKGVTALLAPFGVAIKALLGATALGGLKSKLALVAGKGGMGAVKTSIGTLTGAGGFGKLKAGAGKVAGAGGLGKLKTGLLALGPKGVAVGAVVAGGTAIYRNWDSIRDGASNLWSNVTSVFRRGGEDVVQYAEEMSDGINESWEQVETRTINMEDVVTLSFEDMQKATNDSWDEMSQKTDDTTRDIYNTVRSKKYDTKTELRKNWEESARATDDLWIRMMGYVDKYSNSILGYTSARAKESKEAIYKEWTASKNYTDTLWEQMEKYVDKYTTNIYNDVTSYMDKTSTSIYDEWTNSEKSTKQSWENMDGVVKLGSSGVQAEVRQMGENNVAEVNSRSGEMESAGSNIMQGLLRGIQGAAGAIGNAISGIVGGAVNGAKSMLGIRSPSRVFMEIGDNVGKGFLLGLQSLAEGEGYVSEVMRGLDDYKAKYDALMGDMLGGFDSSDFSKAITVNKTYHVNNEWHVQDDVDIEYINRMQTKELERENGMRGIAFG